MAAKAEMIVSQQEIAEPSRDSLMVLIDRAAMNPDFDVNRLEKLFEFKRQWDATGARKQFDAAVSAAKAQIPPITRNATGHNSKKYADFAAIARVVDPILGMHGLSYRFRTSQTDRINVTCVLSHKAGHGEETTLSAPPDPSGNKSPIHAIGSTLSYLQRYSLVQMLGLASAADDDGKAASVGATITQDQADALRDIIEAKGKDRAAFLKWAKQERMEDIPADQYDACLTAANYEPPKKA